MNFIKRIYHEYMPFSMQEYIKTRRADYNWKQVIMDELKRLPSTYEIDEIIRNIQKDHVSVFPYDFVKKYNIDDIVIKRDREDFPYLLHCGKRLYGKRKWTNRYFQQYYQGLRIEQDYESPHCYLQSYERYPNIDDQVADVGAAEGFFSLDIVDRVKRIYLFECDYEWIEALKKTFKEYMDKVVIIDKYVGDEDNDNCIRLDSFMLNEKVDYIKADIEGAEQSMLKGGDKLITNFVRKMLICTYHQANDYGQITQFLHQRHFKVHCNYGYMLYYYNKKTFVPPYIRRGVVYATKEVC